MTFYVYHICLYLIAILYVVCSAHSVSFICKLLLRMLQCVVQTPAKLHMNSTYTVCILDCVFCSVYSVMCILHSTILTIVY